MSLVSTQCERANAARYPYTVARWLQSGSRRERGAVVVTVEDFNAPIQLSAAWISITSHIIALTVSLCAFSRIDASADQGCPDCIRTKLREFSVIFVSADTVGESIDLDAALRMFSKKLRQLVQVAGCPRLEFSSPVSNRTSPSVKTMPRSVGSL